MRRGGHGREEAHGRRVEGEQPRQGSEKGRAGPGGKEEQNLEMQRIYLCRGWGELLPVPLVSFLEWLLMPSVGILKGSRDLCKEATGLDVAPSSPWVLEGELGLAVTSQVLSQLLPRVEPAIEFHGFKKRRSLLFPKWEGMSLRS